jgi:hypothetical protein
MQIETTGMKAVEALRSRFRGALLRSGEEGYDEPGRFVEIYPTRPSSGAVTTAQPDGSVLAGRALDRLSASAPLLTFPSGLGGTPCAS